MSLQENILINGRLILVKLLIFISGKSQDKLAHEYYFNYFLTRSKIKALYMTVFR